MSIEHLQKIVPPPDNPKEIPNDQQWDAVESKTTILPDDYREFISKYGSGSLDSFIWIFNPGSMNPNLNLSQQIDKQLEVLREVNNSRIEPKIVLFPDRFGVLPFGITDNGDVLLWETIGEANNWTVGVLPSRNSPIIHFPKSMTAFLADICVGNIRCEAFPDDFPSISPVFIPKA